jgi:hypothetical protein
MLSYRKNLRLLGVAFLIQGIGSFISGAVLLEPLIVQGNIVETMTNLVGNAFLVKANIVGEMITAMGIIMLGSFLYIILRKQHEGIALTALGLYVMEAVILGVSRIGTMILLQISQESVISGHPESLVELARLCLEFQEFGYELLMLPFAVGATMFYVLLYQEGIIPKKLIYIGLFAAPMSVIGTLLGLFDIQVPMILYIIMFLPNLFFEVGSGIWLVWKGGLEEV